MRQTAAGLPERILATVREQPGIVTSVLCREVRVRKSLALEELGQLQREQLLRSEPGVRGAKAWFVVDNGLGCSHGPSQAFSTSPPTSTPETGE